MVSDINYFLLNRVADTAKQALGMLEIHFVNIAISAQFQDKECTSWVWQIGSATCSPTWIVFLAKYWSWGATYASSGGIPSIMWSLHAHLHHYCSYLVSFLLDSTIGLLIIYVLLKAVAWVVSRCKFSPLVSGEYGKPKYSIMELGSQVLQCPFTGDPFKFHYWLAQCFVYLVVMLIEKVIVGPLVFFDFWKKVMCHTHTLMQ